MYTETHEKKFAAWLNQASLDALISVDSEGKIDQLNETLTRVTGLEQSTLLGSELSSCFTDPIRAEAGFQEVLEKGFIKDYSLTFKHINGSLTAILFNAQVHKDNKGKVLGFFVAARDITMKNGFLKELQEAKSFLASTIAMADEAQLKADKAILIAEEAVKAKQQFLSNMSHEIRTPMNAIIGFTKVVLKTELTVKQKEYLKAIKVSGDAMILLINDILDLAKVDSGQLTFEETPFKIKTSIGAMLHLFELKIQEKNLKLKKEYDANIPNVLVGDPMRFHQIILNLLSNAVKFTNEGEIKVSATLLNQDQNKVTILFSVKDTGIGIDKSKVEKVFQNFQQASSCTSRIYGGTGLGLAIVKKLVESQGGDIFVTSEIGIGSNFSFSLSFLKTDQSALPLEEIIELDQEMNSIRVLVVEDIALNQLLMKTVLDEFGFDCEIASNGSIAIEKLQSSEFDIILMDLQMPVMNGFETTKFIRKNMNSNIPIIALTADVTTDDIKRCTKVGMDDYLAKPVDDKLLYSKIVSILKNRMNAIPMAEKFKNEIVVSRVTDMNYLMRKTKSNPNLMMEMIELYLQQTPLLVSEMSLSFQRKDWELLQAVAHKMIPSFSIFGMKPEIEGLARGIYEFSRAKADDRSLSELINNLEKVCLQACKELEEEYHRIKNI